VAREDGGVARSPANAGLRMRNEQRMSTSTTIMPPALSNSPQ